mmetsp:Transcript_68612/g.151025  ORF Transcript_68612/g.151025 Transcript_68612/m.151025 type:complete len:84 (-) Transcript_68612:43-294(-)
MNETGSFCRRHSRRLVLVRTQLTQASAPHPALLESVFWQPIEETTLAARDPLRSFIGIPKGEILQEANQAVLQVRIFCKHFSR